MNSILTPTSFNYFPQEIYNQSLKQIEGFYFSNREIEVMAGILLGIDTKYLSHMLPIIEESVNNKLSFSYRLATNTVEAHVENIHHRLSTYLEKDKIALKNTRKKRDRIKYFIQNSSHYEIFQKYCIFLNLEDIFLNQIEKIFKEQSQIINKKNIGTCEIYYWIPDHPKPSIAYKNLARHLNDRKNKNEQKLFTTALSVKEWWKEDINQADYSFYITPIQL